MSEPLSNAMRVAPTRLDTTRRRDTQGLFGAPRGSGASHSGVDIVTNQSSNNKEFYRVVATGPGKIAYSRTNGANGTEGYGFTVIIDHGNGWYTLYAHLAEKASKSLHKVGDEVTAGETIGYMADLQNHDLSTGNVFANSVKAWDKIQVHFEAFTGDPGRSSMDTIAAIKQGVKTTDPTDRLKELGYTLD